MRTAGWRGLALATLVAWTVAGGAARAASPQAIYDAAQAAFDRGDWAAAAAGFEQVAGPLDQPARGHSAGTIRARLAQSYLRLGRDGEARAVAQSALAALGPADAVETAEAWLVVGDAARLSLDMADAIDAYSHARATAPAGETEGAGLRRDAATGLAQAAMTTDPARAAAALDAMLADPATAAAPKLYRAQLEALRGRAALNLGDPRDATVHLRRAVDLSGGLGTSVNLAQIAIRGDTAIAYSLIHEDARTREYLAYTGAGHLKSTAWIGAADIDLPTCDGADLRPEDVAVIELSIAADGSVTAAQPIYASRPGATGPAFARAALDWRWRPEAIAKVEPFWRASLRLQLRCITRPDPQTLGKAFEEEARAWFIAKGAAEADLAPFDRGIALSDPLLLRSDLLGIAAMMAQVRGGGTLDRALAARLDRALDVAAAPASVRAIVLLAEAGARPVIGLRSREGSYASRLGTALPAFDRAWPGTRAGAWLHLEHAVALERSGNLAGAAPELAALDALPEAVLPARDQIRVIAALHLAMLDRHRGDQASAERRIAGAGLDAAQCALLDVKPVATNAAIGSEQFPNEAMLWHFEGYVQEAFDIAADGHVRDVRTVLAYPPFVFDAATERAVARFRYLAPVIGGAAVGCSGQRQAVRYLIPG